MGLEQRLLAQVEATSDRIVALTQDLVRIPSVIGQEGPVQGFVARYLREMGLEVTEVEPDREQLRTHPDFVEANLSYAGRPNVIGRIEGTGRAPSLIINGHVDVVSPEPVERWQYDPWGATIVNDRIYGRGALDMKSGLAAGIGALQAALDLGLRPRGTVLVQSVVEEEAGGAGTLDCLMRGYTADAFLNPEPMQQVTVGMAGILYFRVRTTGKTAHAGAAHLGVNAIGKLNLIYDALIDLDRERAETRRYPLFETGWSGRSCHLNIGTYRAGDWPSTVAGFAEMECRISFIPGETEADVKRLVAERIGSAAQSDPWLREHPPTIEWFGWHTDPWLQDPAHPFVQTFQGAIQDVLGQPVPFAGAAAGLDTRFAGRFEIPALCYGPRGGNMHGIDEFVEIPTIVQSAKAYALTLARWCGFDD